MLPHALAFAFGTALVLPAAGQPALKRALAGTIVFAAPDGKIAVEDGLFVRATFGPRQACTAGVMLRDPRKKPRRRPHGLRTYELVMLGTSPHFACDEPSPAAFTAEGLDAGLYLTVDARGRPVAIQAVGYMYSQLFVREGETRAPLLRVVAEDNAREVGRAAE